MNKWRIIISGKLKPAENMAMDSAILQGVVEGISPNTIRIYDWSPPTVSFGYHQDIANQIDLNRVLENGFGIVRRPTGGRAVLHWDEVTYSVIAKNEGIFAGSILSVYKKIGLALLSSLRQIGIEADMQDSFPSHAEQKDWTSPCFSSASKYEIQYKGKKLVGSAQVRKGTAFLQHGSILLNHNQEKMAELLPAKNESQRKVLKKLMAKKTIQINRIVETPITFSEFANILKASFIKEFGIEALEKPNISQVESNKYNSFLFDIEEENRIIYKKN